MTHWRAPSRYMLRFASERRRRTSEPNSRRAESAALADLAARRLLVRIRRRFSGIAGGACLIVLYGDRELDWLDLVLSELHLGATYDAIARRRLWRRLPVDVLVVPLAILVATYALATSGQSVLLTSIAMYAAVWHRGRQSLGIARFYQRQAGGPISRLHSWLFSGAIYLPMAAAIFLYGHLAPEKYEGEPYYASALDAVSLGLSSDRFRLGCRLSRLDIATDQQHRQSTIGHTQKIQTLHPGERWVVLTHAVAFGSGYVLGATMRRFSSSSPSITRCNISISLTPWRGGQWPPIKQENLKVESHQSEIRFAASFALWPLIGLAGALGSGWYQLEWLAPLGCRGTFLSLLVGRPNLEHDVQWRAHPIIPRE